MSNLIKVFGLLALLLPGLILAQENRSNRPTNSQTKEYRIATDLLPLEDVRETIGKGAAINFYNTNPAEQESSCNYMVGNGANRDYHSLSLKIKTFPSTKQAIAANLLAVKIRELNNAEKPGPAYWKLSMITDIGDRATLERAGQTTTIYFQKDNAAFTLESTSYYTDIPLDKLKAAAQKVVKRFLASTPDKTP